MQKQFQAVYNKVQLQQSHAVQVNGVPFGNMLC